jgi:hypothetical protein
MQRMVRITRRYISPHASSSQATERPAEAGPPRSPGQRQLYDAARLRTSAWSGYSVSSCTESSYSGVLNCPGSEAPGSAVPASVVSVGCIPPKFDSRYRTAILPLQVRSALPMPIGPSPCSSHLLAPPTSRANENRPGHNDSAGPRVSRARSDRGVCLTPSGRSVVWYHQRPEQDRHAAPPWCCTGRHRLIHPARAQPTPRLRTCQVAAEGRLCKQR